MKIYESVTELIGQTPLLRLSRFAAASGVSGGTLLGKLEKQNPGGSVKDRTALSMLNDARERGLLTQESVVIEPTSGNTGIGLASLCAAMGIRAMFVMPETMSEERRKLLSAYGAELVLTPGSEGMSGAIRRAEELAKEIPHAFLPCQFENPANPQAHYETTGPELWRDTDGQIGALVAGVGTGGTLCGAARYLKEQNPQVYVVAVEPKTSAVLSGESAGAHGLQGIGAGFVPKTCDMAFVDAVFPVSDEEALSAARLLAKTEGVFCGISSGAALAAALRLAGDARFAKTPIAVILPDTGERYLSSKLLERKNEK